MFITFEGVDFSGKTTQATRFVEALKVCTNRRIHFIREPGGTRVSERIRQVLLDPATPELIPAAELFLFAASRAQLVAEVIRPALDRGDIVICDRFTDSTMAYQGYGRGIDLQAIHHINQLATAHTLPDTTIFVDISLEEVERRKIAAGVQVDRMENAGRAFFERVRNGYLTLARQEPDRFIRVDGAASVEEVERKIWDIIVCRDTTGVIEKKGRKES